MFWLETLWDKLCGRDWVYLDSKHYDKYSRRNYRICKKSGKFQMSEGFVQPRWITLDNRPVMRYIEGGWRLMGVTRKKEVQYEN